MSDQALGELARDVIDFCDKSRDEGSLQLVRQTMVMHMIKLSVGKQLGEALARSTWPGPWGKG